MGTPTDEDAKHDHLIFQMGPDLEMRFHDPRRFGMCLPAMVADLPNHPRLRGLGEEPLSEAFTCDYLQAQAKRSRKPVKNFLMDAAVVVGVGNIYASESLYLAKLRPTRPVDRLRPVHWARLHGSVRQVLQAAIDKHGTSLSDYVDSNGERGEFQNELLVYGREGEPCAPRQPPHQAHCAGGAEQLLLPLVSTLRSEPQETEGKGVARPQCGRNFPLRDDGEILKINFSARQSGRSICRCCQKLGGTLGYRGDGVAKRAVPCNSLVLGTERLPAHI